MSSMKNHLQSEVSDTVSVIIPVYNVAPYLREALDSVINQTYKQLEIIIIDDGSTDASGQICNEYKSDSRVRVIHQQNMGLSAARNAGLDSMTGEYVAFLDSDDAFCQDMIEKLMTAIKCKNADIAVGKYGIFKIENRMVLRSYKKKTPALSPGIYNTKATMRAIANSTLNVGVWNKIYQAKLWKAVRFPVGCNYEDRMVVWSVFSQVNNICVLPDLLYFHRNRCGSITTNYTSKNRQDWLRSRLIFEDYVNRDTPEVFSEKQRNKVIKDRIIGMLHFYRKTNEINSDEKELLRKGILDKIPDNGKTLFYRGSLKLLEGLLQN